MEAGAEASPQQHQRRKAVLHGLEDQKRIYTDWANHYLAKSGHKRLIKDLQTDVTDGVLLAEIIQVVANEKIDDINGCPKSRSQMIENIDACLSFLAAKGVNIQGLSAEEIRNGNLKAILGLFFSLSRYKQQQQQAQRQPSLPSQSAHPPLSQQSSAPAQLGHSPHGTPALTAQRAAQAEMQSRDGSQSKLLKFSLGQKKTSRSDSPAFVFLLLPLFPPPHPVSRPFPGNRKGNLYPEHHLICMSGSIEQIATKAPGSVFGRPCLSRTAPHLASLLNGL
nr:PREDICTED: neuron navigator 2-like [Paralichthys olivaceus]